MPINPKDPVSTSTIALVIPPPVGRWMIEELPIEQNRGADAEIEYVRRLIALCNDEAARKSRFRKYVSNELYQEFREANSHEKRLLEQRLRGPRISARAIDDAIAFIRVSMTALDLVTSKDIVARERFLHHICRQRKLPDGENGWVPLGPWALVVEAQFGREQGTVHSAGPIHGYSMTAYTVEGNFVHYTNLAIMRMLLERIRAYFAAAKGSGQPVIHS